MRARRTTLAATAACLAFAGVILWGAGPADRPEPRQTEPDDPRDRALLLVHYMPWYTTPDGRGDWGGHWTGWRNQHDPSATAPDGRPDIWSHYDPLIGPYDSADPHVLECHLLQMKLAGVDGVIADWYGISGAADYGEIHEATKALFEATARFGMRFVACYEDRTVGYLLENGLLNEEDVTDHLADTVRWMDGAWFGAPHYATIDGRPLLLNFGPISVHDPGAWARALGAAAPRPALFSLHHLWRGIGADGGFAWVHPGVWAGEPTASEIVRRLRAVFDRTSADPDRVIVSAVPGFEDVYDESFPSLDHRDGATFRESLGVCLDGPWRVVQLVTWNDYGEGTMIEPTHQFGYTFLEAIQAARARESGGRSELTPDDLRLPARLLRLRRSGGAPAGALDEISAMLARGACDDARVALDRLDR